LTFRGDLFASLSTAIRWSWKEADGKF